MENVSEGKAFRMWKFRTLKGPVKDNTENILRNGNGEIFFPKPSPERVIYGCHWMRKRHIDELPQFLNVIAGDMAIVGPRPEPQNKILKYPQFFSEAQSVRAGITGVVQACSRCIAMSCEEQARINLETYVLHKTSLWKDMKVILKTIPLLFKSNSA